MKDMKSKGALAGLVAVVLYGGAEIFDHEERIIALEELAGIEADDVDDVDDVDDEAGDDVDEPESDEDQIEAEEAEAEAQPLIEADEG